MTLEQLLILTRLVDTGSVLATAESIQRTQPTVSVAIKNLEAELGLDLLDRSAYRAKLTSAGEQLCVKARSILGEVDDFKRLARYLSAGHESKLRLAIETICPMSLFVDILKASGEKYPQTEFSLEIENSRGALDKLRLGKVDLAISGWFKEESRLESVPIGKSRLLVVATPEFCPSDRPLTNAEMKDYVQIVARQSGLKGHAQGDSITYIGRSWQVSDHIAKKGLVLAGMGWGRLQEHLIEEELANGSLVPLEIENFPCVVEVDIRAVRRYGESPGTVAAALWEDFSALGR
jgi:DNA-binding transcriptional LysR family regulator